MRMIMTPFRRVLPCTGDIAVAWSCGRNRDSCSIGGFALDEWRGPIAARDLPFGG
jgi:hypothetical protein